MTSRSPHAFRFQVALGLVLAAAVVGAFWIGGDRGYGLASGAVIAAFVAFVALGRRRSGTIEVMSGIGDERTRALYGRALAFTANVLSVVLPAWWLVTVASGEPDATLSMVCAIFGVTFLVGIGWYARRG